MTATQLDSDREMTRRGVMRRTAIGVGAAASFGSVGVGSSAALSEDEKTLLLTAGTTIIGGPIAAVGLLLGRGFSSGDEGAIEDAQEYQSHVNEWTRERETRLEIDQLIASLERDVTIIARKAREQAIFEVVNAASGGGTESEATTAAENAIDSTYAKVERSLLRSWGLRAQRLSSLLSWTGKAADQYPLNEIGDDKSGDLGTDLQPGGLSLKTHTLLDGSEIQYLAAYKTDSSANGDRAVVVDPLKYEDGIAYAPDLTSHEYILKSPDPAEYSVSSEDVTDYSSEPSVTVANAKTWYQLTDTLYTEHTNLKSEVPDMISTYFTPAANGEIDATDAQGPDHLTDAVENAAGYEEAALAFRQMGFAISEQEVTIKMAKAGEERVEATGKLARTVQQPSPMKVGQIIDPANLDGSVYGALEYNGEVLSKEITAPFEILEAEGQSEVTFGSRTVADSPTELTAAEIEQLFKDNVKAKEDAQEAVKETATTSGGGGGGFLSGSDQNWGVIAVGAGIAALGWGYITEDSS